VRGPEPVEHRGSVPAGAVVVPGTRPREFAAGNYGMPCGLIIGERTDATDDKVALNELLRDAGSSLG
jgi:2,3,4,5-tetrahydropyridine-2-carboxylate N-succinyltransferase